MVLIPEHATKALRAATQMYKELTKALAVMVDESDAVEMDFQ